MTASGHPQKSFFPKLQPQYLSEKIQKERLETAVAEDSLHAQSADAGVQLAGAAFGSRRADGRAGDDDAAERDAKVAVGTDRAIRDPAGGDGRGEDAVGPEHWRVSRDGVGRRWGWACCQGAAEAEAKGQRTQQQR